jgi:hypothetical protein
VWKWVQPEAVRELNCKERQTVAVRVIETGSLDAVRRLATGEGGLEDVGTLGLAPSIKLLAAAAGSGQLAVVEHLLRRGCPWGKEVAHAAAAKGHTEVSLWLLAEGCPGAKGMLLSAAEVGHADTCEQLLAAGCPVLNEAAGRAAAGGHVPLMRRLLQLSNAALEQQPEDDEGLPEEYEEMDQALISEGLLHGAAQGLGPGRHAAGALVAHAAYLYGLQRLGSYDAA